MRILSKDLQIIILDTLGRQQLTAGQLLGQLNTDERIREIKLGLPRLSAILRAAVSAGVMAKNVTRYYVVFDAYCMECVGDRPAIGVRGWRIVKYDDARFNGTILADNMTEAEAKVCTKALNEHERMVRASTECGK